MAYRRAIDGEGLVRVDGGEPADDVSLTHVIFGLGQGSGIDVGDHHGLNGLLGCVDLAHGSNAVARLDVA